MNSLPNKYLGRTRKRHHLMLKDLAHILDTDTGNLSRFEAGSLHNLKALIGYHCMFNLSIDFAIWQAFEGGYKDLLSRCFQLLETIEDEPKTTKNRLRAESINAIITRLTDLDERHDREA